MMEKVGRENLKLVVMTLPWRLIRFLGRIARRFFVAVGVLVALGILGYVEFESIVELIDSRYSRQIDAYLGIDKNAISRLHDATYFAQESVIVSEDLKTVACISSPEHRILINDPAEIPQFFTNAILASEDKNFFTHEGIDKGAIVRALAKRILQESRSGASTLTMQIAKHLRDGTGRQSTETEKIGDIVMALRIEREFSRQQLLLKYVNMPYFGRGQYGIEAASRAYFGKPGKDLALHQAAFIVALINRPALPDRSFALDPLLKTREEIHDANWAETARNTTRVLGLMLDQGVISDVEYARAANLVEKSLRKEIISAGIGCGTRDHFLERVRILYKDRFPINKGGLTISITRDDGLQDVLAKAVDLTVHTYLARHPNDVDNNQLRAGAFAVDFTGDVLAEVGNVNFRQLKYDNRDRPSRSSPMAPWSSSSPRKCSPPSRRRRRSRRSLPRCSGAVLCSMSRSTYHLVAGAAPRKSRTFIQGRSRSTAEISAAESPWGSRATRPRCARERAPGSRM
jgi:membrane peptidoglycan carboxypeptidase